MIDKTVTVTRNMLPPLRGAAAADKDMTVIGPVVKPGQTADSFERSLFAYAMRSYEYAIKKENPKTGSQNPDAVLPALLLDVKDDMRGINMPLTAPAGEPPKPGHVNYMNMLTPLSPEKRKQDPGREKGKKTEKPSPVIERHILGFVIAVASILTGVFLWGFIELIKALIS